MIPFSSIASDHFQFLLQNLDASNSDSVSRELCDYTAYRVDESIILIRAFLDHLNINGNKRKNVELESVFASAFKHILNKPSFSTVFCEALLCTPPSRGFLEKLSGILHLSTSEKIGIGLALLDSENIHFRVCGKEFCLSQNVELCPQRMCGISADRIHQILIFLNQSKGLSEHLDAFMQLLSLSQLDGEVQFILFPFISDELHEPKILRKLHFLKEDGEDDFDSLLSEMEKETSIADVMKELGYSRTADVSHCKKTLSLFSPLTEVTIARVVGTISRIHAGLEDNQNIFSDTTSPTSWNPEVLVDSIKQLAPGINWTHVFENLDHEDFYIPSNESFAFFMSVYKHACQDPFPLHGICGSVWKNIKGQISFLKYAVSVPPEEFTFVLSGRQLGDMYALNGPKLQLGKGNHAWSCLDLLEVLCLVAESGHANAVRSILEYPVKHCPEVLLLGMAHVNTAYNLIQKEVSSAIFTGLLNDVSGSGILLHLWHVNPSILLWGFTDTLNVNQENIFWILDVCRELKILSQVLDELPSFFGIRLAAVSSAKELLDLEKWLITNLTAFKDDFYEECLRFLKEVQVGAQDLYANQLQPSGGLYSTFSETCWTFLKVLHSHAGNLSSHHLYEEMENLYADYIEGEANGYFHQVFSGQLTIDVIVQILTTLKESPETRGNLIFECMIANLFAEYKFLPKYPEIQLKIAAVLFGSLIKHQLVTHISLGVALWAILHGLCKPADSKMFVFGEKALDQFSDRLIEWPKYCNYILQISHLRANHSNLVPFVERALSMISSAHSKPDTLHGGSVDHQSPNQTRITNSEMQVSSYHFTGSGASHLQLHVPSSSQHLKRKQHGLVMGEVTPSLTKYVIPTTSSAGQSSCSISSDISGAKPQNVVNTSVPVRSFSSLVRLPCGITHAGFGFALNIGTLVAAAERRETPLEAPASEILDNILFIINNLSDMNVEAKAKEVGDILKEQHFPWFAQYMVMKRASTEANFHDLYLKFLDKLNSKPLNKEILQVTYENCKVLLASELIKSSSEERSLLKNLGSWLGKITIGRNHYLKALEINPKKLILEAYEKGLMIAVIPFISKILESCMSSIAYRPPNPWTMGILGLLAEIFALPNLKINLKFEIEVLFKNLGVDMEGVIQTSLVKHRVREVERNPDSVLPGKHAHVLPQIQYVAPVDKASVSFSEDEKLLAVRSSDQLPPAQLHSQLPYAVNQLAEPASIIEQQVVVNPAFHASGLQTGHLSLSQQQVYEHFGALPWQNQSNQNPPAVWPVAPSTSSVGIILLVHSLFEEWHMICNHALESDTATALFVSKLQKTGLLKGDETTDSFFFLLTEISTSFYLSTELVCSSPSPSLCAIDIYAKLVYCIVKFSPLDQGLGKFYLLSKILEVTVKFIHQDAEKRKIYFNPRPYSRLFINWIIDLCSLDPVSDGANFQVLTCLASALHALQPLQVPEFRFAWLGIVSHGSFMPKLLTGNAEKGWPYFQHLLLDLFQFMESFLRNGVLEESIHLLYLDTLRVLLVLHHDFPEFLCDYHLSFCDVIPSSCIQMRNIILSAIPRNMVPPDLSTQKSEIGQLFEMNQSPRTLSDVESVLKAKQMKNDVDEYLKIRQHGSAFLGELKLKLLLRPNEAAQAGTPYSVPLINSLVLYVGMQAIHQLPQTRNPPDDHSMISNLLQDVSLMDAAMDIFQTLVTDLDAEGRYLFLNAVVNQLRYTNIHTKYFSFVILSLFEESNQEVIQEQIIRVLLERVVCHRPHPWGLLFTWSRLIKDPRYKLWSCSIITRVPEIEKLLELVTQYIDETVKYIR